MTSEEKPLHLIERAAEWLREDGTLPAPDLNAARALPLSRPSIEAVEPIAVDNATPPLSIATLERAGLAVEGKGRARISEEFRIAVSRVLLTIQDSIASGERGGNILMVTSSKPGEGKSFCALNLAACFARSIQREVLIVDSDPKLSSLTHHLGLNDHPGFLDLFAQPKLRIADVIVPTEITKLSILPIGSRAGHNPDLAGMASNDVVIERIGSAFSKRIVILDAAPCLSTSDPSVLSPLVGQTLMIIEAERTQRSEVLASLELVKACPRIMLMLNKLRLTTSFTFGAYYDLGNYA
jgi:protein-tyrosine kinase